jgi:hypothetical protein
MTVKTTSGRAYLCELGRFRDGSLQLNYAIYHNRYQRTAEGWQFTERIYELLRVFRTGNMRLIHAASCPFRYWSMTSCGVR